MHRRAPKRVRETTIFNVDVNFGTNQHRCGSHWSRLIFSEDRQVEERTRREQRIQTTAKAHAANQVTRRLRNSCIETYGEKCSQYQRLQMILISYR